MRNYYRIAGLNVAMDTFGRTEDQSKPYMIDACDHVDIELNSCFDEVRTMYPNLSDDGCEYLASGKNFYTQLLNFHGMMLHASALVMDGKAYLFSAPCGTGKSTHVCLWRRVFGDDRVRVLNDDKPALRLENGTWYAYGTPWCGKTGQNLNLRFPLAGIAIIERGEANVIQRYSGAAALSDVFSQTVTLNTAADRLKQMDLLDKLITQVLIWKLRCNMDPSAAIVSYEAMSGEKWRK